MVTTYCGKSTRRFIFMGCASVMLVVSGTAMAQPLYTLKQSRHMSIAPGTFDAEPGETQGFVDNDEPGAYRICIVGAHGELIVDGKKNLLMDHGDCYDISGKRLSFKNNSKDVETHGSYSRVERKRKALGID